MSYHNTPPQDVKARKRHHCTWCGQGILAGEIYKKWTCIGDDGPLTTKMHVECEAALRRYAETGEYEYDPYSFTRGCTCESGDSGHGTYEQCKVKPQEAQCPTRVGRLGTAEARLEHLKKVAEEIKNELPKAEQDYREAKAAVEAMKS